MENAGFAIVCIIAVFYTSTLMRESTVVPKQLYTILAGGLFGLFFAIKSIFKRNLKIDLNAWCIIIVYVATAEAVFVLFQFLIYFYLNLNIQVLGTFDNPAGLISLLCLALPFALYLYSSDKRKYNFYLFVIILILLAILASRSRTGFVVSVIVIGCHILRTLNISIVKRTLIIICALAVLLFIAYFINSSSADGRILIWRASWPLICDTPFYGNGFGAFAKYYMDYQADFLQNYSSGDNYALLADIVMVPFNEYINLYLCFGLVGIIALIGCMILIICAYRRHKTHLKRAALLSLLTLGFISLFSYPFTYPFTYVASLFSVYVVLKGSYTFVVPRWVKYLLTYGFMALCVAVIFFASKRIYCEYIWREAYIGNSVIKYEMVYRDMEHTIDYMYNYAHKQFELGDYDKSLELALKCRENLAHYDLEMLLGDLYTAKHDDKLAAEHYIIASRMCPNRFIPLKALFDAYIRDGQQEKAYELAQTIVAKPVKVPSRTVKLIKYKMKRFLDQSNNITINN